MAPEWQRPVSRLHSIYSAQELSTEFEPASSSIQLPLQDAQKTVQQRLSELSLTLGWGDPNSAQYSTYPALRAKTRFISSEGLPIPHTSL
jgi:hypothetical protein